MRFLPVLLALTILVPSARAAMYKWTGPDGQVQYGESPPPGTQASEVAPPPPPADPGTQRQSLDQQLQDMQDSSAARQEREAEKARQEEVARIREENCRVARSNLETLNQGGHRLTKMPDGSYKRLLPEEKEEMVARTKKQIEDNCD